MRYPSDEPKLLAWGRHPHVINDLRDTVNIRGHSHDYLHVVFSDSDFGTTPVEDAPVRYTCVSTIERLQLPLRPVGVAYNLTVQDSFTNGEFQVEISIASEEGSYVKSCFIIKVQTNYENLTMTKISSWQKLKTKLEN
jgi:hypothetical protein